MIRTRLPLTFATVAVFTAGCGSFPTTPAEFRTRIAAHHRGRIERWTVDDTARDVLDRLDRGASACLDREEVTCYQGCTSEVHDHTVVDDGEAKTLVFRNSSGGASRREPPGGVIEMVVDVRAEGRRTEVTWTGGDHLRFASQYEALRRWSVRVEHPFACPDIPQGFGALARDPNAGRAAAADPGPASPTEPAAASPPPSAASTTSARSGRARGNR